MILSHIHPSKPPELLDEHKRLVEEYLKRIIEFKGIDIEKLSGCFNVNKDFALNLLFEAVVLHDEGKCNPAFQYLKMKNEAFKDEFEKMEVKDSSHSMLGAVVFFEKFATQIKNEKELQFLLSLSFLIAKHHSKLDDFEEFVEYLKFELKNINSPFCDFDIEIDADVSYFVALKLWYSLLISADYYATLEYMADIKTTDFGKIDIKKARDEFESYEIVKNIRERVFKKEIDKLRTQMFLEAERNINLSKNLFYLQAPTGAGKTLISVNLALKLNPQKIFYIFPFNTLVEQTKNTLQNIFKSIDLAVINSITPIKDEEKDKKQYEKIYLNRLFYYYELIITTHVNLFDILFSIGKEPNFALWQLYGSVIILDEIQSYNNNLWWYMVEFFVKYAKILNLKIIIMSATLPKIDTLLEKKEEFVNLLESKNYFSNPLFKERVEVDFSLLDKEMSFKDLLEKIKEGNKVLIEFIKKQTARDFYNFLKEKVNGYEIYELSGDDNKLIRQKVIERTKKAQKIVVVATQVIEAGVDIDMDLGLKDIATFDSDEQFLGRINRNALKKAKAYFFDLDKEEDIYRDDNRLGVNLKDKEIREYFLNKEFEKCYEVVLERLKKKKDKYKRIETIKDEFFNLISRLKYKEIYNKMELIKSFEATLFFPYTIEIDNKKISGDEIWQKLKELNTIENFAKREIEKSKINYYLQFFTFNVPYLRKVDEYSDECCGIYRIDDYEEFFDEEFKFNRVKFLESQKREFGFL